MSAVHLKKATKTAESETDAARAVVTQMLAAIEKGGERAARDYALSLDKWGGDIVLDDAAVAARIAGVPQGVRDDIALATANVRRFLRLESESA